MALQWPGSCLTAFASRTGCRRTLEALRSHGWGLFVSATGSLRTEGFSTYALDNGAWTAYRQGRPFDEGAFLRAVELLGAGAQFLVVPDIVCGGLASLRLSELWLPRLEGVGRRRLLAVQNGMVPADVRHLLSSQVGIFVGGDSAWKEGTLPVWGELARKTGCYLHVGRVNTVRRIRLCRLAGTASFDGTSVTRSRRRSTSSTRLAGKPPSLRLRPEGTEAWVEVRRFGRSSPRDRGLEAEPRPGLAGRRLAAGGGGWGDFVKARWFFHRASTERRCSWVPKTKPALGAASPPSQPHRGMARGARLPYRFLLRASAG
jgi:hypothetical protein